MSLDTIIVQGTLKPDGNLELDEKPALNPGRVQVTLQPLPIAAPQAGGLAETIEEIRRYQRAQGYAGRTPEELAGDEDLRRADEDEYERRMQEIWSKTESSASTGSC